MARPLREAATLRRAPNEKEKRLPTEVQVAGWAELIGPDWAGFQKEITVSRAPADRREQIARAIRWRGATSSKV
jgi:hypothetical protein